MDSHGYTTLVRAATRGDSPSTRLKNLLFALRDFSFGEDPTSVQIWITANRDDPVDAALVLLKNDKIIFFKENEERENTGNQSSSTQLEPAHTSPIPQPSQSDSITAYLNFSVAPQGPEELLDVSIALIGKTLLELERDRRETAIYAILNVYRERMFEARGPIGLPDLDKLCEDLATAFPNRCIWAHLYDFRSWRRLRGEPLVSFQGPREPFQNGERQLHQQLNRKIYELLTKGGKVGRDVVGSEIELEEFGLTEGMKFYVAATALAFPSQFEPSAGIPYVAVVVLNEPDLKLDRQGQGFLKRFVLELQRVLRFRDEMQHSKGMGDLFQTFLSLPTPSDVARSIVDYLSRAFNATEVAVLERRGMFLSVLGEKDVPLRAIPPLHIPTTDARVCVVARSRKELYDENVQQEDHYLSVVPTTRTQFTVPLIWRSDLVGVLLLGLSVVDGLELRNRKLIEALAGYCAAAIAGSQRTAEERAVSHMLGEVLTGAALKIDRVIISGENSPEYRGRLQTTFDLLDRCQSFIHKFRSVQTVASGGEPIDLRSIVEKIDDDPLLNNWLRDHPGYAIEKEMFAEPLMVRASEEALQLALHNIVANGFDAMSDNPGKITISMDLQKVWYQASRKNIYFGVVKVTDEGTGVSLTEQAKIFDLFYSTKPNHLGSGLSIAERIIEGFGGRIELRSPPPERDKGSEFSLWLPIQRKGK